ncbi:hypothetical protein D3C80_1392780 [compost metagenome]
MAIRGCARPTAVVLAAGVTCKAVTVASLTVSCAALLTLLPWKRPLALRLATPDPIPVANPCATVAVPASSLAQLTSGVTSRVVPSESCRVAVKRLLKPAATRVAGGATCNPMAWALLTSSCALASTGVPLAPTPDAVMVTLPGATPVASPVLVMVAMALSLLRH